MSNRERTQYYALRNKHARNSFWDERDKSFKENPGQVVPVVCLSWGGAWGDTDGALRKEMMEEILAKQGRDDLEICTIENCGPDGRYVDVSPRRVGQTNLFGERHEE